MVVQMKYRKFPIEIEGNLFYIIKWFFILKFSDLKLYIKWLFVRRKRRKELIDLIDLIGFSKTDNCKKIIKGFAMSFINFK